MHVVSRVCQDNKQVMGTSVVMERAVCVIQTFELPKVDKAAILSRQMPVFGFLNILKNWHYDLFYNNSNILDMKIFKTFNFSYDSFKIPF